MTAYRVFIAIFAILFFAAMIVMFFTLTAPRSHAAEIGKASYYGPGFHGRLAANGRPFNQWAMTAAHKTIRLGSCVRVTALKSGRSIRVRITDRGPFVRGRVIDLSTKAKNVLGAGDLPLVRVDNLGRRRMC